MQCEVDATNEIEKKEKIRNKNREKVAITR